MLLLLDDMGIDQWQMFNYGGIAPAYMPNIRTLANNGVKFSNFWSMPACSNGRAALFTGRYPMRNQVLTAIGNNDLANYQLNPSEMTLPRLLHQRGYQSALFGKFHMGIQANNPYGKAMVHALGFDYYEGWLDETGDPSSIDTTAGGVGAPGTYSCGFVPDASQPDGANTGACYRPNMDCEFMTKTGSEAPGRACRDDGGIFDPGQQCQATPPNHISFANLSGHYVSPLTINVNDGTEEGKVIDLPPTDERARTYRTTEVVNAALDWVKDQPKGQPWMVTLSFATDHTPFMQPPSRLLPDQARDTSNLDCEDPVAQQVISNQMEEALDHEIGRFLVQAGIASYDYNGDLVYDPAKSNTYVIVVSDNGSLGTVVKVPFDKSRSKSTAYQTGVWNPAIVSGPGVYQTGRSVGAMVNVVDIYQLVGELAGVADVHAAVPRALDAQPMLPYLTNPGQAAIRDSSYTEVGYNRHANDALNGPCVFSITTASCSQITPSAGVCHDNGGEWWGPSPDNPNAPDAGFGKCCEVSKWQAEHGLTPVEEMFPKLAYAVRNANYKLVVNHYDAYDPAAADGCADTVSTEFYAIDEAVPTPKLDAEGSELLILPKAPGDITETDIAGLTPGEQDNYQELSTKLQDLRASESDCPWDVNLDNKVDQKDIDLYNKYQKLAQGRSSWADVNQDGLTDATDLQAIQSRIQSYGGACPAN